MAKTLAIVPARGGSKGIPRKNLQMVGGMSLVERAIQAAVSSGVVDEIVVTTDDEEISRHAEQCGAWVPYMRDKTLATDYASMIDVVLDVVNKIERLKGDIYEVIVLLEPTVPFRKPKHIAEAVDLYSQGRFKSVITVCPLERKPQNIFVKDGESGGRRYIEKPIEVFTRRQDMNRLCRLSSGCYVVGKRDLMRHKKLILEPIGLVEMQAVESINIDEEIDLELARLVYKRWL